jgi:hypothetical protein
MVDMGVVADYTHNKRSQGQVSLQQGALGLFGRIEKGAKIDD